MRTNNPSLNDDTYDKFEEAGYFGQAQKERPGSVATQDVMTIEGTANKTGILLGICFIAAAVSWNLLTLTAATWGVGLALGGAIGAFLLAIVLMFKPQKSPILAPVYAALEGLFLGAFSCVINRVYPNIVPQAIVLTFGTLATMLALYRFKIIQVTQQFLIGVVAATGGIALVYFISMLSRLFTGSPLPFIHQSGPIGIAFSLFVVVIAALNLVLDFHFTEEGARRKLPKFMEWYNAYGLLVTLVWLYLEILRLLMKLTRRD
jgi:uncharacterized YccA/Bax inhibitor family protein